MVRPLRERIILPIAVAPGFLDWNKPVEVGIQRQRQALTLLQNDSVRSAASSTTLHVGAGKGKVRHIRCRTSCDRKAVFHCFSIAKQRAREGCRICAANSLRPSRARAGSRCEALSHRIRAQRSTCAQQAKPEGSAA